MKESGAQFFLTAIPSKSKFNNIITDNQYIEFSDKIKSFALDDNIEFIDLTEIFNQKLWGGGIIYILNKIGI